MSSFDLNGLNPDQREAVLTTEGPVLMIAGPGTGKTHTLVNRLVYLVLEKGVRPEEIMIVTFTEKAGQELLTRISNEFARYGLDLNLNELYIGTFHSVCLRLLKEYAESAGEAGAWRVLDDFEQPYLVCRNLRDFQGLRGYEQHIRERSFWRQSLEICRYVNQMMEERVDLDAMDEDDDEDMRFLARLVRRYQALLNRNGVIDFSSIQTKTYDLLVHNPAVLDEIRQRVRYYMVDEYQDTNFIQEQLIFLLAGERKNLCVVGDDDQGMYRFRGATIRNILEFPSKFPAGTCRVIHLDANYRSEPGIIEFYNRWMANEAGMDLFCWDKYRYEKQIRAEKEPAFSGDSVFRCGGVSLDEEKRELLAMLRGLIRRGNISDYNQVALLFRSVKSEEAVEIGKFLEENGIPVYSPRSDLFFEQDEVKELLGCLMMCFPRYLSDLKQGLFVYGISDRLRAYYIQCLMAARSCVKLDPPLLAFLEKTGRTIQGLREGSELRLLDIFYRIIAFSPFREYLQISLKETVYRTRAARNLSELSRMLAKFSHLHGMHVLSEDNKDRLPEELFNVFLKYLHEDGIGEYEDVSEYAPSGCISIMTIHQSKGLEFPVVVVGSLGNTPRRHADPLLYSAELRFFRRKPFEPLRDIKYYDFWRLYYTAFYRAQNLLVLAERKASNPCFQTYLDDLPYVQDFQSVQPFAQVKAVKLKQVYSYTTHIAVYDDCPRQYKYFRELGFARNQSFQASVGSLVHATLEDMNRRLINEEQDQVTEEIIRDWFALNYQGMREENGIALSPEQWDSAMDQAIRYYSRRGIVPGRVWKAEEEIDLVLPNCILKGIVDLVLDLGDSVEILDYKTGPKPNITEQPQRIIHYRRQLELYAYLVERRFGRPVSRMHLYYTSQLEGDPMITFDWDREAVDRAVEELKETVARIENKAFEEETKKAYVCAFCDMKYVCGKASEARRE